MTKKQKQPSKQKAPKGQTTARVPSTGEKSVQTTNVEGGVDVGATPGFKAGKDI